MKGLRYRVAGVAGSATLVTVAMAVANHPWVQGAVTTYVPLVWRLEPTVLANGDLAVATLTALAVTLASLAPLYKPRPRRILDTAMLAQRRVFVALLALAAIGYFNYTYRLPRATLGVAGGALLLALPVFFVAIRSRPASGENVVIVGDDVDRMREAVGMLDVAPIGYVSPGAHGGAPDDAVDAGAGPRDGPVADGGVALGRGGLAGLDWLGSFARLDDVLVEHDVDTAVLAFDDADREDFFAAVDECYEHGVAARAHPAHADLVLSSVGPGDDLVDVELEPLDAQDYALKRAFDVAFAAGGLLALSPVILAIAAAIELDDGGPLLYGQERTSAFGDTFTVHKFRSMVPDAEDGTGAVLSDEDRGERDPRVTRVGRVLRRTHLDEIPQLWSVLVGDMSVVGPRPERPELETAIERDAGVVAWRKRWFVKPGLTGLAQINEVTGAEPARKLEHDLRYIRDQSFWLDIKIVIRQVWKVALDVAHLVRERLA